MKVTTYDELKSLLGKLNDSLATHWVGDSMGMSALSGIHYELLISLEKVLHYANACQNSDITFESWYQFMMQGGRGDYFDGALAKGVLKTSKELNVITTGEFQILAEIPGCDNTRSILFMHCLSEVIEAICVRVSPYFNCGEIDG